MRLGRGWSGTVGGGLSLLLDEGRNLRAGRERFGIRGCLLVKLDEGSGGSAGWSLRY